MKARVSKWGDSLVVRIPRAYAQRLGLCEGSVIELLAQAETRAPDKRTYCLADLLARVTSENRHDEVDFGPPLGNESW